MALGLPNWLTLARIALIPVFVTMFYLPNEQARLWAAGIFLLAAATDWLDGYLARKWNQCSALGAFLDPVADKLIVVAALLLLIADQPTAWILGPSLLIVAREIVISALREWMATLGQRDRVKVSQSGKIKTTLQMLAILFLLIGDPCCSLALDRVGLVFLYLAAALTLWSMAVYLKAAWPFMVGAEKDRIGG